ncbi:MAG: FecR domain-containing protein [Flavobacteriaceae bacterium]
MDLSKIEKSIINFVNRSCSAEELDELEKWAKDTPELSLLKEYVRTHFTILLSKGNSDPDKIKELLFREIRKESERTKLRRLRIAIKYAAIVIFMAGASYFISFYSSDTDKEMLVVPHEDAITLKLQDGTVKIIKKDGSAEVTDKEGKILGRQQGRSLVYDSEPIESSMEKLVYNTLTVPYGKRFDLVLSDGTHVFLNAGTSMRYPVRFIDGYDRDVFLQGEAFFDVTENPQKPFTVHADKLGVRVLGTRFNVADYPEDAQTDVVLVDGSVGLHTEDQGNHEAAHIMEPGNKASFDKSQKTIVEQKVNTSIYTAWVNGDVVFRDAPFKNIVKRLERLYNVTIINNNIELADEIFNASFEVGNESINDILRFFNQLHQIDYKIEENTIIIN